MKRTILMLALLALVLGGCRDFFHPIDPRDPVDPKDPVDPVPVQLTNIQWCLQSITGPNGAAERVDPSLGAHIIFSDQGTVKGFTGYNEFWGDYASDNAGALSISNLVATKRWGGEPEPRYLDGLRNASSYKLSPDGSILQIWDSRGGMMQFAPCSDNGGPSGEPGATEVELGMPFKMTSGGMAVVKGEDVSIEFNGIVEDSRCPMTALCPWTGNAAIELVLSKGGISTPLRLNTHLDPKRGTFMEYTVELVELNPYPVSTDPIPQSDYIAVLRVTKN